MATEGGPSIIADGLVLYLDAANVKSLDTRNLLHNTNSFTGWTRGPYSANVVLTPNSTISPDGNLTATKFQFNDAAIYRCSCRNALIKLGNTNTFSVYAKAVSGSATIMLDIGDQGNKNFTVNDTEWTRCHITHTRISQYGDTTNFADIAANAGTEIYLWGAQLNHGGLIDYVPIGDTTMSFNDLSNNGNGGALVNGPVFDFANGGSISFDGINDIIYLPFVLDTSTNFTIEVTVKNTTMISEPTPQNRQTVWAFTTDTSQGYQLLDLEIWNNGISSFNGNNVSYTPSLLNNFILGDANSTKIYTLSKSGSSQSWYVNSDIKGVVNQTYTGISQYFKLGGRSTGSSGGGQPWNGPVYIVRIYNRALTATEVLQNYNATKGRFDL